MSNAVASALDIGCGNNKRDPAAVGMDIRDYDDADVIHDLNETPWPFDDNQFERIDAYSVLEHVEDIPKVMAEIHRIAKPSATVRGKVPHWKDRNAYIDPTHTQLFDERSFEYWDSTTKYGQLEYFENEFRVVKARRIRRVKFWKSRPITFELKVVK
jgi:SAM-dependent methyltransferase